MRQPYYSRGVVRRAVHIVWSPATGPIAAYDRPDLAWDHARAMLGVDVAHMEVLDRLPSVVVDDLVSEYDEDADNVTPPDVIAIDEID
jgi:hypothetical protein